MFTPPPLPFLCVFQVCVNVTDPRVAQCAAYDHRRHSDGHRYRWEPYPDLSEPCALTCRAIGTSRVRQLSPRVIDGTRCRDGSLDICIDGKCEVSAVIFRVISMILMSKTVSCLRARPKAERVFAEYENFLKLSDRPTDRDAFQRLISFEPSYRLTNGFRHLKATFNKSFVLA